MGIMSSTIRLDNTSGQVADQLVVAAPARPRLEPGSAPPVILRREESGPAPLSFAQERFWFLDQINPGDASSNISRGVRIKGDLKQDLLQRSLQAIVNRHESLRTTFATNQLYAVRDSKPVQLLAANRTLAIPVIDLSHEFVNQREAKARDLAQGAAQRPFDLTLGPLLQATLLRLADREHVLLLSLHRIVCDDSSLQILIEELWAAYSAFANGAAWPILPLQIQYADYAAWQRKLIEEESIKPALDFWRANLQGAPAVIELPTDRPKPPVRTWHGQSVLVDLEKELVEQLRAIGASEDAALAMVLLAALKVVLARHSRQHDLVVGFTIPNRDPAEIKHLVGPLSSLLSLRTSLSGDPTFRELLSRVQSITLEAHAHRSVPFEKLLEELQLERSLSHAPVFQVAFNLDEAHNGSSEAAGVKLEEFEFDDGITRFDLMVDIFESPSQLDCRFRYSTDLFDHATIERLGGHFKSVLEGIVSNPNQRVSALPLLTQPERKQVLVDWNNTETDFAQAQCISQLFERQASLGPSAIAVTFQDQQLTYAELNARANQLARHLRSLGVGPETLVGICIERSLEMVIGLLGILKAGGAYVPLDPAFPNERLAFMMEDAGVSVLLTLAGLSKELPRHQAKIVALDADLAVISRESSENLAAGATSENLAYVIYTSGSTGRPKGTMNTHLGLCNRLLWMQGEYQLTGADRVLQKTPYSFDVSVWEFFWPLITGARLIVARPGGHQDASYLVDIIHEHQITTLHFVPSMLQAFVEEKNVEQCQSVRQVISSGEALTFELQERFFARLKAKLHNLYGPTEASIDVTAWECQRGGGARTVPIGRPIANTQIYVLDEGLKPVPIGVAGELHIGGTGVGRGYLNRPDLTAEKFVPDPFAEGLRLYKTGDLARYLPDGNIEYLGRVDHQVKIRGFRIELGEIEAVLREHSFVRDVAVVARQGKLVAYVVGSAEQLGDGAKLWSELRGFIKAKLPEYMSPAIFVELDALPLTPSGKVDRRALPIPDESRPDLQQAYVGPRDRLEEQLVTLWTNVLQLKSIGVRDNFFELGGHSLLAARLFAQIENRFGKHLPLATLFQSPTIEQLANALRDSGTSKAWSSLVAIQPEGSRPPLFCVHAAGANVLIYRPLSRHLGNDQPVYALQAQGLDGQARPLTRVEDMAALYIKEMRAFQPEGPYFLLGASFGGLAIYEMAQQLLAQDQEVALLAMLNTSCPVYTLAKRMRCHVGHLMQHGPRFYAMEVGKAVKRRLTKQVAEENNASGNSSAPDPEIQKLLEKDSGADESLVRTVVAILAAEGQYVPARQVYPGKITLFWAHDAGRDFEDNRLAWRRIAAGGFDLHVVPGTHTSMREEPNVAVLVEKLKPCLEAAQAQFAAR
ncbi:MAG TPA: non-ribosomal peptide synthetase [Blastocatellia bacterium]|jgi:amino acid adenylation domain-containing protein|nr:non-ribosomal peptide synthetase [Blastocatellia bacterium]HCX28457.1 non-ribosomal peptide synthetase [Blastocatellia bacterium]